VSAGDGVVTSVIDLIFGLDNYDAIPSAHTPPERRRADGQGRPDRNAVLPGMRSRGLVDVGVVRRWWRRALSAPATTKAFWIVIALEVWAQQFIDDRGRSR
jgi:hypothetical protein